MINGTDSLILVFIYMPFLFQEMMLQKLLQALTCEIIIRKCAPHKLNIMVCDIFENVIISCCFYESLMGANFCHLNKAKRV